MRFDDAEDLFNYEIRRDPEVFFGPSNFGDTMYFLVFLVLGRVSAQVGPRNLHNGPGLKIVT